MVANGCRSCIVRFMVFHGVTRQKVHRLIREGLTAAQIADELGMSTQNVYKHIGRLRQAGKLPMKDES